MDTALQLRLLEESNLLKEQPYSEVIRLLSKSKLIDKLTSIEHKNLLSYIWNLIGIAEIPNAIYLEYTQNLVLFINKNISTDKGFSYTGSINDIVPCYNAMIFEAYCRLGLHQSPEAQNALRWIKNYQVFDRVTKTTWPHNGICKHGGCMKNVPCYIGIGKTIRALITYREFSPVPDKEVNHLIHTGLEYMLQHNMFQRLSNRQPISDHITDIMFPQSYVLSFTDLVYIVSKTNSFNRPEVFPMMEVLRKKQTSSGGWKTDYNYSYNGYIPFDTRRKDSEWITALFSSWLGPDIIL
ncbi:hypothetical protein EQ871_16660 [Enterococcus casseliflavus]|jgi:hypothetical protein|uniref:hypothetical protein n=1 Tax=Enterococcus casseliflavus TaxID=37734 RepID=UPI000FFBC503|nr:hypothetical protein [Enterococcus casseliflavus]RXA58938.1 hypothetical protein EQ871_16660 [Enterococcus casseliflavus]